MRTWPKGIQEAIGACRLEKRVMSGASTDLVYRIEAVGGRSFHLKVAGRERRDRLRRERDVLNWLAGRLWAPTVETYCEEEQEAFLLMSSAPGLAAAALASGFRADAMLAEVARTLRQIHALPVQSCPFDRTLSVVVAEAYRNAADGQVELDDLDHERRGWSTDRLLDELNRGIPKAENCVFTHGDFACRMCSCKEAV